MPPGSTTVLDEVGELSAPAQARLPRVLADGIIERVGDSRARCVDVRIVAATNRDLGAMVEAGQPAVTAPRDVDGLVAGLLDAGSDFESVQDAMLKEAVRRCGGN